MVLTKVFWMLSSGLNNAVTVAELDFCSAAWVISVWDFVVGVFFACAQLRTEAPAKNPKASSNRPIMTYLK